MSTTTSKLRLGIAFLFVAVAGVFSGTWVARATTMGKPSGLSFTGTLRRRGVALQGQQQIEFRFKRNGGVICSSGTLTAQVDSAGNFQLEIPLEGCPDSLFDGGQTKVDVLVGDEIAAANQSIGTVPYAKYAERTGIAECPVGYELDRSSADIILCRKGEDEVVRAGSGNSAFWVDRYEASIWEHSDGTGQQYGAGTQYPQGFPSNGQGSNSDVAFAVSKGNVFPSLGATWFQAGRACRANGKRLPSGEEWLTAATGTPDPGKSNGALGACLTSGTGARRTGEGSACASVWGAQDMIGNAWEWTADWFASLSFPNDAGFNVDTGGTWPAEYGKDRTWNIISYAMPGPTPGIPVAAGRGGTWWMGKLQASLASRCRRRP